MVTRPRVRHPRLSLNCVVGYHVIQYTKTQNAFDDVASTIHQSLPMLPKLLTLDMPSNPVPMLG